MSNSSVVVAGTTYDTFTTPDGIKHRQALVVTDPDTLAAARVTDPATMAGAATTAPGWRSAGEAANVNSNAIQKATYHVARGPASGVAGATVATVANIDKVLLTGTHLAAASKTVRIRRIVISAWLGAAATYLYSVYRVGATAPAGGTAVVSRPSLESEAASEMTWNYLTTTALDTLVTANSLVDIAQPSTATGHAAVTLYDWQESGETKPLIARAGVAEGFAIAVRAVSTVGPDPIIQVTYTEE